MICLRQIGIRYHAAYHILYINDKSEAQHCTVSFYTRHNDHSLMQRLSNAGTEHRKYMRMMPVYVRITAPLYWWKEFDTYKIGTVANSCSTMHKIAEKEFTLEDFSCEHLGVFIPAEKNGGVEDYKNLWIAALEETIDYLNVARTFYNRETDPKLKKDYWWQMIQLLPSSYNQTRNVKLNYEVLANIYRQRKNHKLDEWREFCKWIETLPYSELITGKGCIYTLNDCVRCVEFKIFISSSHIFMTSITIALLPRVHRVSHAFNNEPHLLWTCQTYIFESNHL